MLDQIRIVLVETSHPGNIGSVARAMKTMGLSDLALVSPKEFPSVQATALASGADDLLANATVVETFAEAVADCELVFATSHRDHALYWPAGSPREAMELVKQKAAKTAIVFGTERIGMTNEEMALCQYHIRIPTNPDFTSLNLAQAVQVLCYECRQSLLLESAERKSPELATNAQLEGFYQHLDTVMQQVEFLNPKQPRLLQQRLRALYSRTLLTSTEIDILRGFLSMIQKQMQAR